MRSNLIGAAFLLVIVGGVIHAAALHCIADDAYISFRYARNLLDGHGLVFNPGERVDGYTDFLWIVLLAAGMACGASAEATALALGFVSLLLLGWGSDALGRALFSWSWRARWMAVALLASLGPVVLWCVSGLETGLFTAVVLFALAAHVRRCRGDGSQQITSWWLTGSLFGVATLLRPDAAIFAGAAGLHLLGRLFRARGGERRFALREIAALVASYSLFVVPYWSWRTWYYGDLLPNTWYAKAAAPGLYPLGVTYLRTFLAEYPAFIAVTTLAIAFLLFHKVNGRVVSCVPLLVLTLAAWTAYVTIAGGDYMPLFRFLVPVLPLAVVLSTEAFAVAGRVGAPASRLRESTALVLIAAVAGSCVVPSWRSARAPERRTIVDTVMHEKHVMREWLAVGRLLRAVLPSDTTIAVSNAGVIPYCSGLVAIDQSGLCDRYTARVDSDPWVLDYPGHAIQATKAYLERRRPDLILWRPTIEEWAGRQLPQPPSAAYVTRALRIQELTGADGAGLFLYLWVRRDALPRLGQAPLLEVEKRS